jgi:hypothetical protein
MTAAALKNAKSHFGILLYIRLILHEKAPLTINWLTNIFALSVPGEGYSRNAHCALNLISTFLSKLNLVWVRERDLFILLYKYIDED